MQTQTRGCEQWQNEGQFHLISHPRGYILFPKLADFKRDQHATKITVAVQYQIETLGYFKDRVLHEYAALHLDAAAPGSICRCKLAYRPSSVATARPAATRGPCIEQKQWGLPSPTPSHDAGWVYKISCAGDQD
jgi:hypothetical protein